MPRTPFRPTADLLRHFYEEEGFTVAQLADLLDAGETTVRDWMDQEGIRRRDARFRRQEAR